MQLSGGWVAVEADDEVRRHGIEPDAEHAAFSWEPVDVPGRWVDTDRFREFAGPLMYRRRFNRPAPPDDRRRWLVLDGVMYQADVWMDGAYLGDPEGYFFPHAFDVTALSALADDHVVAIEVTCATQGMRGRRNLTGVLQHDASAINPGGLWRPVSIEETGPVRIDRLRVLCRDADSRRAHVRLTARLDAIDQRPLTIRTTLDGAGVSGTWDERTQTLAAGANEVEWTIDISEPPLWWPRRLGDQALIDVTVEVLDDGVVSDRTTRRIGLRQVVWDNWICSINGERLFLKGANAWPPPSQLADAAAVGDDIAAAIDLGLDVLRVNGHIADRPLYASADERGLLLLQDFPLQWGHARSVRGQAVEQARATVDLLAHHPSIVMWNAHNDPTASSPVSSGTATGFRGRARTIATHQLPTWNKSVLDRWVKRAFERADPSRVTIAHSGVVAHLPQLDGTDSHFSHGWAYGEIEDLAARAARQPRSVRFVSEFGATSVPTTAPFFDAQLETHRWPALDWDLLEREYGFDRLRFERRVPAELYPTFERWRDATQSYQAELLRLQIEALRRVKYRPAGGFCFSSLRDERVVIGTGIIDSSRVPKLAYAAVRQACAPLVVVSDPLPRRLVGGHGVDVDLHAINDGREPVEAAVLDVHASWPGGNRAWRFGGDVPADGVVKVGRLRFDAPRVDEPGDLTLALTLTAPTGEPTALATNRYAATITPSTSTS